MDLNFDFSTKSYAQTVEHAQFETESRLLKLGSQLLELESWLLGEKIDFYISLADLDESLIYKVGFHS